ncbi:hypothetical protein CFB3_41210 [Clostridium folliculivorans]|uniref:Uncharacterized protein n=1 Tax=Clostridium folliculivorans TaxID=2886038 RepID=A0A9W6DBY9_9CLOT|nr:hypothetical protein CFOLD11_32590 [Clostridium folliculivorans]GKU32013.1 hypothetical protein CFB3_41210 [Clostridium folliculivorans]
MSIKPRYFNSINNNVVIWELLNNLFITYIINTIYWLHKSIVHDNKQIFNLKGETYEEI